MPSARGSQPTLPLFSAVTIAAVGLPGRRAAAQRTAMHPAARLTLDGRRSARAPASGLRATSRGQSEARWVAEVRVQGVDLQFVRRPSPGGDVADDRLSARLDSHVLNAHSLRGARLGECRRPLLLFLIALWACSSDFSPAASGLSRSVESVSYSTPRLLACP